MSTYQPRSRRDDRATRHIQEHRRRFAVEQLEGRRMLSTFTVSNVNDSGTGSLRWAITQVDSSTASTNTINFNIPLGTPTITPATALPAITRPVLIDGTSELGYAGTPVVVLTGAASPENFDGLTLDAAGVTVRGLVINDFFDGVTIESSQDVVSGCYVGTDLTGTVKVANDYGITLLSGAVGNTIGGAAPGAGNLISDNVIDGISVDTGASKNLIEGNLIGTGPNGSVAINNNQLYGVHVYTAANGNTIGGTTPGARNVISDNVLEGVYLDGASGTVVEGDYSGTNAAGTAALGNANGVLIAPLGSGNTIGGTTAGAGNVLSGNGGYGVAIADPGSGNVVEGNLIGTDASGTYAIPNAQSGVFIQGGSVKNTIGGTTATARNVISGNADGGVLILGAGTTANLVEGNFIGTNSGGTGALPNQYFGVEIQGGATDNTIGGTTAGAANVISGNSTLYIVTNGVVLSDPGTSGNVVAGNFIGTDVSGSLAVPNGGNGVQIQNGATDNSGGGSVAGARNIVSGNAYSGIVASNPGTSGNVIEGNFAGVNLTG